jgi:hypothetical protein
MVEVPVQPSTLTFGGTHSSKLTSTTSRLTYTVLNNTDSAYAYKQYASGYFGDFNFNFVARTNEMTDNAHIGYLCLSNTANTTMAGMNTANDGICFGYKREGDDGWFLRSYDSGTDTKNYCNGDARGCWLMEDTGSETDASGSGASLTNSGTIAQSSDSRFGKSRSFDGTTYLYRGDGGSTDISGADAKLSIVMWVKPSVLERTNLVTKRNFNNNQRSFLTMLDSTGKAEFYLSSAGTSASVVSAQTAESLISTNTWTHLAFVYDDVTMKIYVNGVERASQAYTAGIFNSSAQFQIGFRADSADQKFTGLMDEVAIFNRALSESEIAEIKDTGLLGNSTIATDSYNQTRYINLKREGSICTASIYSDSSKTNHVAGSPLSITCGSNAKRNLYLAASNSSDSTVTSAGSGYIENITSLEPGTPGSNDLVALLDFSLSGIQTGSTIVSVQLQGVSNDSPGGTGTVYAFSGLRSYLESQATWNVYTTGNSWGTSGARGGADYVGSYITGQNALATYTITGLETNGTLVNFSNVQSLKELVTSNVGGSIKLVLQAKSSNSQAVLSINDSEAPVESTRPRLIVNYDPPITDPTVPQPSRRKRLLSSGFFFGNF